MKYGSSSKRSRSRGGNSPSGKGTPGRNRVYDSNGPDVRIRGTAHQIAEKYMNLAKDAYSSGDRVMSENYMQHAEHYQRIIAGSTEPVFDMFGKDSSFSKSNEDSTQITYPQHAYEPSVASDKNTKNNKDNEKTTENSGKQLEKEIAD